MSELALGAAPETRRPHFWILVFGAAAAPLFWIGQLVLAYWVTAEACYPGDRPLNLADTGPLGLLLILFDGVAILGCCAGFAVAFVQLRRTPGPRAADPSHLLPTRTGRDRFLALWGVFSSLWFFFAILFNVIASLMVPLCLV